jgi:hypothetical protein
LLDQRADVTIVNGNVAFSTGAVVAAAGHQLGQDPVSAGTGQKDIHCHRAVVEHSYGHLPENRLTVNPNSA